MSENATPNEIERLEKLAIGLLTYSGDPHIAEPRLFLGKIPENLPIEIPMPERSRVLGALARSEKYIEIVLESDLKPEEIVGFYRTQLSSQGWNEPEELQPHQNGGFLHTGLGPHMNITFCQASGGAGLTLSVVQLSDATANIHLNLGLGHEMNPCAQQARNRRHMQRHHRIFEMIPPLTPPQGAQQQNGGGNSGPDQVHTTATLKTNLALDVLAKHYADQLVRGGWTQTDTGASGPLVWYTWRFTNEDQEPWSGLFFVLKTPEQPDNYFLCVRASWIEPESDQKGSGWYSSTRLY
ncbi:MAG TPA: hypothetical protein VFU49_14905 [Ktedonobacteraceae bacterium]|nr:hypothetical protein [Ktedonobacteraceae bacterium]